MKKLSRTALTLFAFYILSFSVAPAADQSAQEWTRYLISAPDVVYPAVVKRTGQQGNGVFQLTIDRRDGTVTEVKVLKSTGYLKLVAIYVMNFFQWRFKPGTITSAKVPRGLHITGRARGYY